MVTHISGDEEFLSGSSDDGVHADSPPPEAVKAVRRRKPFPIQEAIDLYTRDMLSLVKIGNKLGYSFTTVNHQLKRHGVKMRPVGGGARWLGHTKATPMPPKEQALIELVGAATAYRLENGSHERLPELLQRVAKSKGWKFTYYISRAKKDKSHIL